MVITYQVNNMQISAAKFKANCLKLMDEVSKTNKEIIITKYGKPVAKLVANDKPEKRKSNLLGSMVGKVIILGDIMEPNDEIWSGDEENL